MISSTLADNEATAGRGGAMDLEADNLHQQVGVAGVYKRTAVSL